MARQVKAASRYIVGRPKERRGAKCHVNVNLPWVAMRCMARHCDGEIAGCQAFTVIFKGVQMVAGGAVPLSCTRWVLHINLRVLHGTQTVRNRQYDSIMT